jgi:phytoene/squalene synthetase
MEKSILAEQITRKSSLQAYYIIRLLADKTLVNAAYRAYAYFRWLDDLVDDNNTKPNVIASRLKIQEKIINFGLKKKKLNINLCPEEKLLDDLLKTINQKDSKLRNYILNFFEVMKFDFKRRGKRISKKELEWYSNKIAEAVTNCIEYFVGNNSNHIPYPQSKYNYHAARGAHKIHMLRDYQEDQKLGYFNIPKDADIKKNEWFNRQLKSAKKDFKLGKMYIAKISNIRTKIAAYLYCLRFERLIKKTK